MYFFFLSLFAPLSYLFIFSLSSPICTNTTHTTRRQVRCEREGMWMRRLHGNRRSCASPYDPEERGRFGISGVCDFRSVRTSFSSSVLPTPLGYSPLLRSPKEDRDPSRSPLCRRLVFYIRGTRGGIDFLASGFVPTPSSAPSLPSVFLEQVSLCLFF